MLYSEIRENDSLNWEAVQNELEGYFDDKYKCIIFGTVGRWNGTFVSGTVFEGDELMDILSKALKDCDYISITDENGHLYVSGTHHDGDVSYEIRILTEKGVKYLENWEEKWDDNRTEQYVHNQIVKYYSVLPHFAKKVYGCGAKITA